MGLRASRHQLICLAGLGMAALLCATDLARASVISATPTLPVSGGAYVASGGAECFTAASLCVTGGSFTLTSTIFDTSVGGNEAILANAIYSGEVTTLGGTPVSPLSLTGTIEQEVVGRASSTDTGTWTADLTAIALSGTIPGHTLALSLDGSSTSSGTTSIVPSGGDFLINSFFDVFFDLSLDGSSAQPPVGGPIEFDAIPEPISLLVLLPAGLGLLAARRRGNG